MAKPLALVLSDLHFGEAASVVNYKEGGAGSQPVVRRLVEIIEGVASNGSIPFLIVAGDTLDLSLAAVGDAVADFHKFLEDIHAYFDAFVYIPGNHDHHVWRTLQEEVYVVKRIREGNKIKEFPQEQFGMIEKGDLVLKDVDTSDPENPVGKKTFLHYLLPVAAQGKNFAVTYPNLLIEFDNPERNTLITHGHFFEKAWTLASDMFGKSLKLGEINYVTLERINSPVTEFGWYGIGQAGELSKFIEGLYKDVKNSKTDRLTQALDDIKNYILGFWKKRPRKKKGFFARIKDAVRRVGASIKEEAIENALELLTALLKGLIVSQLESDETQTPGSDLRHSDILKDPEKQERIARYVRYSIGSRYNFRPGQIVFGHTHRPIKDGSINIDFGSGPSKVKAFNPGGWVVDCEDADHILHSRPMPLLILDDGQVRALDFPWPAEKDKGELKNKTAEQIREMIKQGQF
jgi:hypothetical protein